MVYVAALFAFEEAACNDPRFFKGAVAEWTYSCQGESVKDIEISLEFLQMGGSFATNIKIIKPVGEGFRAGMGRAGENEGQHIRIAWGKQGLGGFLFSTKQDGEDRGGVCEGGVEGGRFRDYGDGT